MKRLFKIFIFLTLVLNFNQLTYAKPLPPGSGEGDVPANILILLDSSKSMKNKIGDAIPDQHSFAIDGDGNRVIASADSKEGGLILFDSAGTKLNITGTNQSGVSYTRDRWWSNNSTDQRCDFRIRDGSRTTNHWIGRFVQMHEVRYHTGVSVAGTTISNENLLFVAQYDKSGSTSIIALDNQYRCRLAITPTSSSQILGYDTATDSSGDLILAAFGKGGGVKKGAYQLTCNITDGACEQVAGKGKNQNDAYGKLYNGWTIRLSSDATKIYISANGHLFGYHTKISNGQRVIDNNRSNFRYCRGHGSSIGYFARWDFSSSSDNVFYVGGHKGSRRIHRVEWTSNTMCRITATAGTSSGLSNSASAGNLDADDIRISDDISGLQVTNGRLIFSHNGYVDELTEASFTAAGKDSAWQIQYGGPKLSRLQGAQKAITAVLTDTSLTSGANFGFGHWNGGAPYYGGWQGNHPDGRSRICNKDSCFQVGISPEGAAKIVPYLSTITVDGKTDANAWSQMAHDYFFGPVSPHDPNSDCQLNFVIVIGDGKFTGGTGVLDQFRGQAAPRITRLRQELGVKTLMVAYGDGIDARGMAYFDALAVKGSCDTAGGEDCEPTIVARTPQALKTELQQKIKQILAERLAFTAPSITATIQQGGSLYQAQFAYEQFGEWKGTILRKTLNADGTVEHDPNAPGNWDAAVQVRAQSSGGASDPSTSDLRNIWTPLSEPSSDYIGNWDNVSDTTAPLLEGEMTRLGFDLLNYHTSSSNCGGDDTTDDERDGLLRFLAGQDFFDYNGNCDTTELREHVLGDIYHSQLIEIGAPDGNTQFTDNNQEAYFRSINNYQAFRSEQANRRNVLYAGSNSGLLHAFNAETGNEEWAFLPPFLVGKLPTLINANLDGKVDGSKGGSNAIFGVDGSPVVHDVFMRGLTPEGEIENSPSWHTILFQPFGRGGSGFSVLDVTEPIVKDGLGPLHMFTVYNDYINNVVYIMDYEGEVRSEEYYSSSASLSLSEEAEKAQSNLNSAVNTDGGLDSGVTTQQDLIAACQSNANATTNFRTDGTASCYIGKTFTFNDIFFDTPNNVSIDKKKLNVTELVDGEYTPVAFTDAKMVNGQFVITFPEDKIQNPAGISDNETRLTNNIFIQTSCTVATGIDPFFDYSKLGETWSTPRIVKLPSDIEGERSDPANDKYVAIMGAGMANNNLCAGSALFMVELDNLEEPGRIYGGDQNSGPITIVDTSPDGVAIGNDVIATPNGSDINNAVPTTPLVITPDTAFGIPWRGAMVYINDREGKITKINLTDSTENNAKLFDQTTLFRLNANTTNQRYTFFSMDAGVGVTTKDFWLFGGTGDFNSLGAIDSNMDNILYGVRDFDFPFFKHLNGVTVPSFTDQDFTTLAHQGANNAKSIDDATVCSDVTGDTDGTLCPDAESAWVIHLDTQGANNTHRKASAPPTLFKGQVYFPVYEPPPGSNRCNIGNAYICVADDECGTNNSHKLVKGATANGSNCTFIRKGVLSELVIFGDKLYANVAGPSENPDTLYSVLAVPGEVLSNRGGWRDTGY